MKSSSVNALSARSSSIQFNFDLSTTQILQGLIFDQRRDRWKPDLT